MRGAQDLGFQREVADGAWATHMRFGTNSRVHRIPPGMPVRAGVLVEPLACALHGVERADVRLDDVVVLAVAGPIGLLMLSALRRRSPAMIVVTDLKDDHLEVARRLGADLAVNVDREDPVEVVHEYTDGYGRDVFIEATGTRTPWSRACRPSASSGEWWCMACSASR